MSLIIYQIETPLYKDLYKHNWYLFIVNLERGLSIKILFVLQKKVWNWQEIGFWKLSAVFTPLPKKKKKMIFFFGKFNAFQCAIIICYNHDRINEMCQNWASIHSELYWRHKNSRLYTYIYYVTYFKLSRGNIPFIP